MWARVVRMPGASSPGFMETIRAAVAAQVPITLASPGNRGVIALVDPAAGTMVTITLWETLDALHASGPQMRPVVRSLEVATAASSSDTEILAWSVLVCDVRAHHALGATPLDASLAPCARIAVYPGDPGPDLTGRARAMADMLRPIGFEDPGLGGLVVAAHPDSGRVLSCVVFVDRAAFDAASERLSGATTAMSIAVSSTPAQPATAVWQVLCCEVSGRVVGAEDDAER